jgi:hypothetical protein
MLLLLHGQDSRPRLAAAAAGPARPPGRPLQLQIRHDKVGSTGRPHALFLHEIIAGRADRMERVLESAGRTPCVRHGRGR